MVEGVGQNGGLPEPIDGNGDDGTQGNPSEPPPGATPRKRIDPRLGGLVPGPDAQAEPGRSASFRNPSDAAFEAGFEALMAQVKRSSELRAQANELLPAALRAAYEQSEKVNERAACVRNLDEVKAVLAQEGVGGPPPLPADTPGAVSGLIGGLQLEHRERPKPLCTLALRISEEDFPEPQRYPAFLLVLGAISKVQFKRDRVEPLADMAEAASSVEDEGLRTEGYEAVLRAAQRLWQEQQEAQDKQNEISAADYAHIVVSLSLNFRYLSGDTRDTRGKLRLAIEVLPEEHRDTAYNGLAD